jgi:hypothetical protein
MFRTGIETTKTNTTYGMGIEKSRYFDKFAAFLVGICLFRLFQNTETPCFDIKTKQPKQMS